MNVHDRRTGRTTLASPSIDGEVSGVGVSNGYVDLSADGRQVAFTSGQDDLVAGDDNDKLDVFVRDLRRRTTTRASVDVNGDDIDTDAFGPAISGDGHTVTFETLASDLVPGDGPFSTDVFARTDRHRHR